VPRFVVVTTAAFDAHVGAGRPWPRDGRGTRARRRISEGLPPSLKEEIASALATVGSAWCWRSAPRRPPGRLGAIVRWPVRQRSRRAPISISSRCGALREYELRRSTLAAYGATAGQISAVRMAVVIQGL
jgi:hypothetical protein